MDAQNLKFHRKTQFFSLQTRVTYSIIIALQDISNTPKPEAYIWISTLIRVNPRINLVLETGIPADNGDWVYVTRMEKE